MDVSPPAPDEGLFRNLEELLLAREARARAAFLPGTTAHTAPEEVVRVSVERFGVEPRKFKETIARLSRLTDRQ